MGILSIFLVHCYEHFEHFRLVSNCWWIKMSTRHRVRGVYVCMGFALPGPGPFFLYAHTHTLLLLL